MEEQNSASCNNNLCAVYPGSFDPLTFGHIDIVQRALNIFQNVIILVAENRKKQHLLEIEERIHLTRSFFQMNPRVQVEHCDGLLVEYMKQHHIPVCIRGLRALSDFEYEFQMAMTNKQMYTDFEVMFFMSSLQHVSLSSSVVKEIIHFHGDIRLFVPESIAHYLENRRKQ